MNKRSFLKGAGLASLAMTAGPNILKTIAGSADSPAGADKYFNWVWHNPGRKETEASMHERYSRYFKAGIRGVFLESDVEPAFRIAKSCGLQTHRWIWTMNRNDKELLANHPDWYSVSRKGDSCAVKPPYVDYYRFLCPSREEVQQFLVDDISKQAAKDYVDGIHLDYIRYCDVFLPPDLWKTYNIVQDSEMAEYDFCYCENCKKKYKEEYGHEIMDIPHLSSSPSLIQFRLDNITHVVNRIAEAVHTKFHKKMTAAVFPTPFLAKRNVRQDWVNWNLDGVCPMIYHSFYNEGVPWIGKAVSEGVKGLHGSFPLYAGLYLPGFKDDQELEQGLRTALNSGAGGVSMFSSPKEAQLQVLERVLKS